jgi:hypothetical protein
MKAIGWILSIGIAVLVVCLLARAHVPPELLLVWSSGAVCLGWVVALVTIPWNLHFHARAVRADLERTASRGVAVEPERIAETVRIARRTLVVSIAAHIVSAAIVGAIAAWSRHPLWLWFGGFFLVSVGFRPGFEYFRHLRHRLRRIHDDARYPFEDVASLIGRVDANGSSLYLAQHAIADLERRLDAARDEARKRDEETDQRIAQIVRRFDETLDRLTDNREIVAGLKAFLRMVRTDA